MEDGFRRSGDHDQEGDMKKEVMMKRDDSSSDDGGDKVANLEIRSKMPSKDHSDNSKPLSPKQMIGARKLKEDKQLESARAEMNQVREENHRLKTHLSQIMRDYRTLQQRFVDAFKPDQGDKKCADAMVTSSNKEIEESDELVSLSLGRTSSDLKKLDDKNKLSCQLATPNKEGAADNKFEQGLSLGLDCKFEASKSGTTESLLNPSPDTSIEEAKEEEEAGETWPPSKVLKTMGSADHDEVSQQNPVKKARVSVRARCDTPTMNDGCQWRKYGQKIAKGNPCPRAYYRCTVAPSCPVRKQVQRCADDMSILITTYEGTHNHPLPMSATAMASTTSAAAQMLLSGSSSSRPSSQGPSGTVTSTADLHGLNFYPSESSKARQYYLPATSFAASSTPTITLDLTSNPSSSLSASSSSSLFSRFPSQYASATRYPSASLSFNNSIDSSSLPLMSWGNGLMNYSTTGHQLLNSKNQPTLDLTRQAQESNYYQSYLQKSIPGFPQQALPDSIAAATKAITADPSFQSALAAALKSIIGNGTGSGNGNQGSADHFRS